MSDDHIDYQPDFYPHYPVTRGGITLRDYFATHALEDDIEGYVHYMRNGNSFTRSRVEARYVFADAMLKAREAEAEVGKLETLKAERDQLLSAALVLWKEKRPIDWDEPQHMEHPTVNCVSNAEKWLAEVVVSILEYWGHGH